MLWLDVSLCFTIPFPLCFMCCIPLQDMLAELRQGGRLRLAKSLQDYVIRTASLTSAPEIPTAERLCMRMDAGGGGAGPAQVPDSHKASWCPLHSRALQESS